MRILYIFKIIVYILLNTKFRFCKPKKSDILLYDQGKIFNKFVFKYFKKEKISIIYVRFEELNLYVLAKVILCLKFMNNLSLFQNYINEYCRITKPIVLISSTLWDERFLNLKKNYSSAIKLILVQPFRINKFHFKNLKKKTFIIDYVFVNDEESEKVLKKYFISTFLKTGSFKNNFFKQATKKKTKKTILFVSGVKSKNINKHNWKKEYLFEKKIVRIIEIIYQEKKIFKILLKPEIKKVEYLNFVNCSENCLINNKGNGYKIIDKYDLIITVGGSMGKEALARGIKHVEIPYNYLGHKPFYVFKNKINQTNIRLFLDYFSKINKNQFFGIYEKKKLQKLYYDKNNSLFVKIVKDNLKFLKS